MDSLAFYRLWFKRYGLKTIEDKLINLWFLRYNL